MPSPVIVPHPAARACAISGVTSGRVQPCRIGGQGIGGVHAHRRGIGDDVETIGPGAAKAHATGETRRQPCDQVVPARLIGIVDRQRGRALIQKFISDGRACAARTDQQNRPALDLPALRADARDIALTVAMIAQPCAVSLAPQDIGRADEGGPVRQAVTDPGRREFMGDGDDQPIDIADPFQPFDHGREIRGTHMQRRHDGVHAAPGQALAEKGGRFHLRDGVAKDRNKPRLSVKLHGRILLC